MTQTRWLCQQCSREWVYAANWNPSDGYCPTCKGASIERVTYAAIFAGADIRTTSADLVCEPPPSDPPPAIDPKYVHINENQTLALACPEFA